MRDKITSISITIIIFLSIAGCIPGIDDKPFINPYDPKGSIPIILFSYLPRVQVTQGLTIIPSAIGSYNYGNVKIGNISEDVTFTIQNLGWADLSIQNVNSTDQQFTISTVGMVTELSSNNITNFTIHFKPNSLSSQKSTITINNNDLTNSSYSFTVSGNGCYQFVSELENASNVYNASGSFGNPNKKLINSDGNDLTFSYGSRMDDPSGINIYDNNPIGSFDSGKYFRIIVDGNNVSEVAGLGLKVRAMNLNNPINQNPPAVEAYVNPASGLFVLPRPSYWSKCEDPYAGLSNPEISEPNLVISKGGDFWSSPGVGFFNNGIAVSSNNPNYNYSYIWIKPYGTSGYSNKGTASFWAKRIWGADPEGNSYATIQFNIGSIMIKINKSASSGEYLSIEKEGNLITKWTGLNWSEYTHFYIVWDKDGALNSNTKTIRIFVDGTERLSDNSPLDFTSAYASQYGTSLSLNALCETLWRDARTFVDNIKIWNHVVSEDPAWEYNSGSGREDALHYIYGPANGYRPGNIQVGYYYLGN